MEYKLECSICHKKATRTNRLYWPGDDAYCRDHFPGADPAEQEVGHIDYDNPNPNGHHLSLDYGSDNGTNLQVATTESIESFAQRLADHDKETQNKYVQRLSKLNGVVKTGMVKKILSTQQYDIFQGVFYQKLNTSQIARLIGTNTKTVDNQVIKIGKKLKKLLQLW